MPDYTTEPPLNKSDRDREKTRAAKFRYKPCFALTIECADETDQQGLYKSLASRLQGRRIRVVVA